MQIEQLREVGLFSSLSKHELEKLARWTDEVSVSEGQHARSEQGFGSRAVHSPEVTARRLL